MTARRADVEPSPRRVQRKTQGRSYGAGRFVHGRRRGTSLPRRRVAWRVNRGRRLRATPAASARPSVRDTSQIARRERIRQPVHGRRSRHRRHRATHRYAPPRRSAHTYRGDAPLRSPRRPAGSMIPQIAALCRAHTQVRARGVACVAASAGFASRCATVASSEATVSHRHRLERRCDMRRVASSTEPPYRRDRCAPVRPCRRCKPRRDDSPRLPFAPHRTRSRHRVAAHRDGDLRPACAYAVLDHPPAPAHPARRSSASSAHTFAA